MWCALVYCYLWKTFMLCCIRLRGTTASYRIVSYRMVPLISNDKSRPFSPILLFYSYTSLSPQSDSFPFLSYSFSGDDGIANSIIRKNKKLGCSKSWPDWPASSAFVTAVGATQLSNVYAPACTASYDVYVNHTLNVFLICTIRFLLTYSIPFHPI